jgi:ABC-type transporter Mla MlaB component
MDIAAAKDTDSSAARMTSSPPTKRGQVNAHKRQTAPNDAQATLVFDEVLDAKACRRMRRFQKEARRTPQADAAIDLRRTRSVASSAWAMLVKGIRDLSYGGARVTVIAGEGLQGLLQLSGIVRYARIIIANS